MLSRAIVALTALAVIAADALSAQQPGPGGVCLEAECLEATVQLSGPTVVLVIPPPDAALPDSALLQVWKQRVDDLYRTAHRATAATDFGLEVRAPNFRGFRPALPQAFYRLFQGYVILAPGQRAVVVRGYMDEEALRRALATYRSPVQPLEGRLSS